MNALINRLRLQKCAPRYSKFEGDRQSVVKALRVSNTPLREVAVYISMFCEVGVSEYNWCVNEGGESFAKGVLILLDQDDDLAWLNSTIKKALEVSLETPIYIKSNFTKDSALASMVSQFSGNNRVEVLPQWLSLKGCLKFCESVHVRNSIMGFEALLFGRKVITYSESIYSGFGLTEDRYDSQKREVTDEVALERLFEILYLEQSKYFDPDTSEEVGFSVIVEHIARQKGIWSRFAPRVAVHCGDPWKKKILGMYIQSPVSDIQLVGKKQFDELGNAQKIVWGARQEGTNLLRIEDGFIRSKGLGVSFNLPLSLVLDDEGMYFDARKPSTLENCLENNQYSECQLEQARQLRNLILTKKLTKYNLIQKSIILPQEAEGKKLILVPGQVEGDASILYGSPSVRNNLELIKLVRAENPNSYIFYKPHPDTLKGLRKGSPVYDEMYKLADKVVKEGDVISWIESVDEVHTMTSTVGFEALMHEKKVVTYGMPFYAGWGLTTDTLDFSRRSRKRNIDELVYAVLIEYPIYLNPNTQEYISARRAAELLANPNFKTERPAFLFMYMNFWKKIFYRLIR